MQNEITTGTVQEPATCGVRPRDSAPYTMLRVRLDDGRAVRCFRDGDRDPGMTALKANDRVQVEVDTGRAKTYYHYIEGEVTTPAPDSPLDAFLETSGSKYVKCFSKAVEKLEAPLKTLEPAEFFEQARAMATTLFIQASKEGL